MGRELKRVPLNFKWEINKLWCGYHNPHSVHECTTCNGGGWSKEYKELENKWYSFENSKMEENPYRKDCLYNVNAWSNNLTDEDVKALIKDDRLWDFTRVPITDEHKKIVEEKMQNGGNSWLPFNNGYIPTAQEVNEWNLRTMGHDSINAYACIKARLKKDKKSHLCPNCKGTGADWQHPKAKRLYNSWRSYNPPVGDGFQLWCTTTEGHPMTPVFKTLEELCQYCEEANISVFGSNTATKEEWLKMLDENFVYHKNDNGLIFI